MNVMIDHYVLDDLRRPDQHKVLGYPKPRRTLPGMSP